MKLPTDIIEKTLKLLLGSMVLIVMASCASTRPPTDELARSQAAINQAEQVGARDYAPLELREAKKKLDEARQLLERKDYERATRRAHEAEVDAELAEAKTLSGKAQKAVKELKESIKTLKEEILRNQQKDNN